MSSSQSRPEPSAPPSRWLWLVIALAVVGVGLTIELTRVHVLLYTDDSFVAGCDINDTISCSKVEQSEQAILLGVPLSIWGLLGYLVVLGIAISGRRRHPGTWPVGALLGVGLLYSCMSAYNAYVSLVILDAVCPFCVGTYAVNLALLLVAGVVALRQGSGLAAAIRADVDTLRQNIKTSLAAALVFAVTSGALIALYPHYWQRDSSHAGSADALPSGQTSDGDHWIGATNPAVTIVEFSDYECPFCARSNSVLREVIRGRSDELRLVHRHFPLDIDCNDELDRPFHRHSCQAARAALCAGQQDKFWQMNDALYANQKRLKPTLYAELADQLKLDRGRFDRCMQTRAVDATIKRHVAMGAKLGAHGTPFYLVNGTLHMGALSPQKLNELIAQSSFGTATTPNNDASPSH